MYVSVLFEDVIMFCRKFGLLGSFLLLALAIGLPTVEAAGKARLGKDAGKNARTNPSFQKKESPVQAPTTAQAPAKGKPEVTAAGKKANAKALALALAAAEARRFVVDVPAGILATGKAMDRLARRNTSGFQEWPEANGYFTFLRAGRFTLSPGGQDITYLTHTQKRVGTFLVARSTRAEEGLGIEGAATQQPPVYFFEIGNPRGIRRLQPVFDPSYPMGYVYTGYADHGIYLISISAVQVGRSAAQARTAAVENAALEAFSDSVEDTTEEDDEEDEADVLDRKDWLYEVESSEGIDLSYRITPPHALNDRRVFTMVS